MKFSKLRLSETCRTSLDNTGDNSSHSVALGFHRGDKLLHFLGLIGIRTSHDVVLRFGKVILTVILIESDGAHL